VKKACWLIIAVWLLSLVPASALAASWVEVEKDSIGSIHIDKDTLQYDAGRNFLRFWTKSEYRTPIKAGGLNDVVIRLRETEVDLSGSWKCRHWQVVYREASGKEEKDILDNPNWVGCFRGMPLHPLVEQALQLAKTGSSHVTISASAEDCKALATNKSTASEAIRVCTAQIEKNSADTESLFWRGFAYARVGDTLASDVRNYQANFEAIADFTRVLASNPEEVLAVLALGNRAVIHNRIRYFREALADANRLIQMEGESVLALMIRGEANDALGSYDEAIMDYNKIIQMNPRKDTLYRALQNRSLIYEIAKKKFDFALTDIEALISLEPSRPFLYEQKAKLLVKMGRKPEAAEAYKTAIGLIENDSERSKDSFYLRERDRYLAAIRNLNK